MDLGILIPVVVAIVVGAIMLLLRSSPSAQQSKSADELKESKDPSESSSETKKESLPPVSDPWVSLGPILKEADSEYSSAAHPSALMSGTHSSKGIELLSKEQFSFKQIMEIAQSDTPAAACIGLEALSRRKDSENAANAIFENFDGGNSFILYYILRYMEAKDLPRAIERCLGKCQYWWESNTVAVQCVREHVNKRVQKGETFTFLKELDSMDADDQEGLEKFMRKLGVGGLEPLFEGIKAHRRKNVDLDFLNSFGQTLDESLADDIALHDGLSKALG